MAKFLQFLRGALFKRQRAEKLPTKESTLARFQARKMVAGFIEPALLKEGFCQKKGSTFWRTTEWKSDVIEVRFATLKEVERAGIPKSSFSIWAGSYFTFMPNPFDESFLHQIDGILTPLETYCHFRLSAQRGIKHSRGATGDNLWCLTGMKTADEVELNDALCQIQRVIIPALNEIDTLQSWIDLLASEKLNLGFGQPDSQNRNFLLGCAYLHANNSAKALKYLTRAQVQSKEIIKRTLSAGHIREDSPLLKEKAIIEDMISRLTSTGEQSPGSG
jgi:hypothetical protein